MNDLIQTSLLDMSNDKQILFYRVNGEYVFLSNLYKCEIEFEDKIFSSSEAAYQYGKAKNPEVGNWIISAPKQHLIAAAGHGLFAFDIVENWNHIKVSRMYQVLKAKFTQHSDLKAKLLETENKMLLENSKTDAFWGIGKRQNGKNMLGRLLMELRTEFQRSITKREGLEQN